MPSQTCSNRTVSPNSHRREPRLSSMWIIFSCAVTEASAARLKLRALFLWTRGLKRVGRANTCSVLRRTIASKRLDETLETDLLLQRALATDWTVRENLDDGPRESFHFDDFVGLRETWARRENHSERSACMTSTRAARAAGSIEATTAAPNSTNAETITGNAPGIFKSPK
jgi:hypothetical protein